MKTKTIFQVLILSISMQQLAYSQSSNLTQCFEDTQRLNNVFLPYSKGEYYLLDNMKVVKGSSETYVMTPQYEDTLITQYDINYIKGDYTHATMQISYDAKNMPSKYYTLRYTGSHTDTVLVQDINYENRHVVNEVSLFNYQSNLSSDNYFSEFYAHEPWLTPKNIETMWVNIMGGTGMNMTHDHNVTNYNYENGRLVGFKGNQNDSATYIYENGLIKTIQYENGDEITYDWTFITSTEKNTEARFKIFPNPSNGEIQLEGFDLGTEYFIYSITGQILEQGKLTTGNERINIEKYSGTMVFVQLQKNGIVLSSQKVIVQ